LAGRFGGERERERERERLGRAYKTGEFEALSIVGEGRL
jgi:hypothetical protein